MASDQARKAICLLPGTSLVGQAGVAYTATINPNAVGGTAISSLQIIDYSYHLRGMLRGINLDASNSPTPNATQGDLFSYKLDFETAGYWDGNIGKETWKSSQNTGQVRSYTYNYDKASRLLSAVYAGGLYTGENYSLSNISYDKNGNIKDFWRHGMTASNGSTNVPTAFGYIDKMNYQYTGNRLNGIQDVASNGLDVGDFRDNGNYADYTYHPNGSLNSDANRGIGSIAWDDLLAKPTQINYNNGRWIKHFYDGSGKKMKTTDSDNSVWEYFDGLILKNNAVYQLNHDEGRAILENNVWQQEFSYQDHLGNARLSFKAVNGQLILSQENAYYPFGMSHTGTDYNLGANTNNFLYNGKEKINSFGLNFSDYGFRNYDLLTNRFISVDPLASKFPELTTFQYASNNPVANIDLDGLEGLYYNEKQADGTDKQVIEKNVVVLVDKQKEVPAGSTPKEEARIEKQNKRLADENKAKVEAVKEELNNYYGDAKDEKGSPVEFRFNVTSLEVKDTDAGTPNNGRIATKIGLSNGLLSSSKNEEGVQMIVPAAVVTTGDTKGSLGLSNGVYVNKKSDSPNGTIAHEISHTFLLKDNNYTSGGILNSPPQGINAKEIKEIIQKSKPK
jgi:RHS repeat-associated protein